MILRPKLVVLDEPNSNLDVAGDKALAKAIEHARDSGITTIVIEHNVDSVMCHADKLVLMDQGMITYAGPPRQRNHGLHLSRRQPVAHRRQYALRVRRRER